MVSPEVADRISEYDPQRPGPWQGVVRANLTGGRDVQDPTTPYIVHVTDAAPSHVNSPAIQKMAHDFKVKDFIVPKKTTGTLKLNDTVCFGLCVYCIPASRYCCLRRDPTPGSVRHRISQIQGKKSVEGVLSPPSRVGAVFDRWHSHSAHDISQSEGFPLMVHPSPSMPRSGRPAARILPAWATASYHDWCHTKGG